MYNLSYYNIYGNINDPGGWLKVYRSRKHIYSSLLKIVFGYIDGESLDVLDLGCGLGFNAYCLATTHRIQSVRATDISAVAIDQARKHAPPSNKLKFQLAETSFESLGSDKYHIIFLLDVFEHLDEPSIILDLCSQLLVDRGLLVLTTPNPQSIGRLLKAKIHKSWFADNDPTHISIKPASFIKELCLDYSLIPVFYGTDFLWDPPYLPWIPSSLQRLVFKSISRLLMLFRAYLPWAYGENTCIILRKSHTN